MSVKNEKLSEYAKEIVMAVRYLQIKWRKPFSYLLHLTFDLWPAMGDAAKLWSNIVGTSNGWCCGGCTGSGDGRDNGDGEGVLLFGISGLQTCTPSKNPCPLQARSIQMMAREVMVNRRNGGSTSSVWQARIPARHPTTHNPQAMAKEVMIAMWTGGEGVFPWCVNALIWTSSYIKQTSSQLVTSNPVTPGKCQVRNGIPIPI